MNAAPVRVGLIGFGYVGRVFHAPLIAGTPGVELAAVASSRGEAVRAALPGVALFDDPAAMIASGAADLIVVASPNDSHAAWAVAALEAGRDVVVEKPFALTLDEARGVAAVARRTGRLLSVFHNRRWDSDFLSVRAAIGDGLVGRVAQFDSHFDRFRPQVRDRWREAAVPGAGIWYDLGPHLIDQALQLFGLPEAVEADLAILRDGGRADDWAHAVLAYPRHRAILHASTLVAGGVARFSVHGDRGSIAKVLPDRQEAQLLDGVMPGSAGWGEDSDPLRVWDGDGASRDIAATSGDQRGFYRAIAAAVRGEGGNPVPPEQAIAVMAVIEAGVVSAREGRRVALPLSDAERAAFASSIAPDLPLPA